MTRTDIACYALIASAMVLGGLAIVTASDRSGAADTSARQSAAAALMSQMPFESVASADFVVNKNIFTFLSARGISDEDFLYVLDNKNEKLVCYRHLPSNPRIELFAGIDIRANVDRALQTVGGGGGGSNRSGRTGR